MKVTVAREKLTPRLLQLAELIAAGHSDKEIAPLMGITVGTINVYLSQIYQRVGVERRGNSRVRLTRLMIGIGDGETNWYEFPVGI